MKILFDDTVSPDEATGDIAKCYGKLNTLTGQIHEEFSLFSVSPAMFASQLAGMEYLANHPKIKPLFWTLLRYMVSVKYNNKFCMIFNKPIMEQEGINETQMKSMVKDWDQIPLPIPEKKLLHFVLHTIDNPESVSSRDIDELKSHGWSSCDIFEATLAGARHIAIDVVFNAFIRY